MEEAAHAAGAEARVLGAPRHSCGAPLGPAGVQGPCAAHADGPERRRGHSRFFFLPAGEEEEEVEEEKEDEAATAQLLFLMSLHSLLQGAHAVVTGYHCASRCLGVV